MTTFARRARAHAPEIGFFVAVLAMAIAAGMPGSVATLGVLNGGVLALNALGMLLVFRTDRIINFAQVQIGAVGATFFVIFARYEPILTLIRNACPTCIERVTPAMYRWNYVIGALLGLGISALLGWLTSVVLMRRFASQPRLIATVGTLFLVPVLGLLQRLMANLMVTSDQKTLGGGIVSLGAPTSPGHAAVRWGPATFGIPEFVTAACAIAGIVAVTWFLRTTSGASLRAVADSADRAATLGLDVGRTKSRAWAISGLLSGVAGISVALAHGASPAGDLGVSAAVAILAVLVIARMSSLPVTIAAALALGVLSNALFWRFNAAWLLDGILIAIIGLVLLGQRDTTSRAERLRESTSRFAREIRPIPSELRRHPAVRSWTRGIAIGTGALVLALPLIMSPSQLSLGTVTLLLGMVGLSLLVLTGWAGQISLGHMAFAGIGGYVAAVSRLPFPVAILLGGLAGALVAVLVGIPALRLRGMHLAVTTLALSLAASTFLFDENRLGRFLPSTLKRPAMLHLNDDRAYYYLVIVVLALVVVAVAGMRRSRFARVLIGARDNDQAAESFAVPVVRVRLQSFAISGFIAALAGALLVFQQTGLRSLTFTPEQSLYAFLWTVIGGLGAISGPLLGATVRGILDIFGNNQIAQFVVSGIGGVLLLVAVPGGLARVVFDLRDGVLRRFAQRNRIVVPSLLADVRVDGEEPRAEIAPREAGARLPARYRLEHQWAMPASNGAKERARG